jgi:hypothetical protein
MNGPAEKRRKIKFKLAGPFWFVLAEPKVQRR